MQITGVSSLERTVSDLMDFRGWRPYQYSGRWYVAYWGGEGHAYRSRNYLKKKAAQAGIRGELRIAVVG